MAITLMVNGRADSLGIEPEAPLPWALGDTLRRTARARFHTPTTVDGSALYGIDFSPPDLLYAAVDIAPVLVSVDRAPGATMSDLRCVVQLAEAVVWWRTATGRPDRRQSIAVT